jgi:polyphosphate glucokinase
VSGHGDQRRGHAGARQLLRRAHALPRPRDRLGSALIIDGILEPTELAHLPYKKGRTYEDYVGKAGLKRLGKKKWRRHVLDVVTRLKAALEADDVVIGGGNAKLLKRLPRGVRLGANANAFLGYRLWKKHA